MKHTRDNRRPDQAAAEKDAPAGESGAKEITGGQPSGQARSWKQYIEQTMPVQEPAKAENNGPSGQPRQNAPDIKEEAGKLWNRFAQWAEEFGRRAGANAAALRGRWNGFAGGWRKLGRNTERIRNVVARHPVSPLLYATVLAVGIGVMAFKGTYARAYVMEVNGQQVAVVSGKDEADAILGSVENRVSSVLGEEYGFDAKVTLAPVYVAPDALSDADEVAATLFDEAGAYMTAYAISVDGQELGYAAGKDELYQMLDDIAQPFIPENAVRYEFLEDVEVYPVEVPSNTQYDVEKIRATLSEFRVEQSTYVVKKGDTFNAIAYSLDMWPIELSVLNPDVIVDKIWVDQELIIQEAVPFLSVQNFTDETYEETVPSPVEYIETADLYVGDTKVKEQGEDGLQKVNARVTYVNGVEVDREILTTETLKEPTTTYAYTGTTPRPVTASNGYFIWPVRGTITSNFGGRNLWGRYDFHLGLDIACRTGTSIKAADGGTVIKAGWSGSYGNLVAIRHDNGYVTYYAHNSSLLVSVGQKVYQGQIIARSGATGNVSGPHCHFEVRINNTSVNPRNYLP